MPILENEAAAPLVPMRRFRKRGCYLELVVFHAAKFYCTVDFPVVETGVVETEQLKSLGFHGITWKLAG